jgi:hypothetical protein
MMLGGRGWKQDGHVIEAALAFEDARYTRYKTT